VAHRFRFLGEKEPAARGLGAWLLGEDEARHAAKILRLQVGDEVEVTNGRGDWAVGRIAELKSSGGRVDAEVERSDPRPPFALGVAVGALKPGDVDDVIPALAEMGVDHVRVFGQDGAAKARLAEKAQARWTRILEQAIKQCKRAWLPELAVFGSVDELIAATAGGAAKRIVLLPSADATLGELLAAGGSKAAAGGAVELVIGGEQGFSEREEALLEAGGYRKAALGSYVLRANTAAVAAAAVAAEHRLRCGC
jgi:16S rRNA (uracil1498-N3)-methyltransferase